MSRTGLWVSAALSAILLPRPGGGAPRGEEGYVSPRFESGQLPALHPLAQNGGLAVVELQIAASGIVTGVDVVDDAPPFAEAIKKVARLWRYRPATLDGEPISSRASVVALCRPPILLGAEAPPTHRVRSPSGEVPYPRETATPPYPPNALYEGVVAVEVEVDAEGGVADAQLLSSAEGFQSVAVEAARKFRFEPAERQGHSIPAYALVVFGFPQPITGPHPRR